jgi:hypothetical protein
MSERFNAILEYVMPRLVILCLLLVPFPLAAESVTIAADQWARPRNGEMIAGLGQLRKVIEAFDAQPDRQIVIHYANGESATLWAEELRSWLVSLGIPSSRITLAASLGKNDVIIVETTP